MVCREWSDAGSLFLDVSVVRDQISGPTDHARRHLQVLCAGGEDEQEDAQESHRNDVFHV